MKPKDYLLKPGKLKVDKTLGYLYFLDPKHPLSDKCGKVYYHRHMASLYQGGWVSSKDIVHHRDGDKLNNTKRNLQITTRSEHGKIHNPDKKVLKKCKECSSFHTNKRYCSIECATLGKRKVGWPSKNRLKKLTENFSRVKIAKMYGVSDNAVKKWQKKYKII